jgi:hypothetical protein
MEHIHLWQTMEAMLPTDIRWIFTGDWNLVLLARYNSHASSKVAGDLE